MANALGLEVKKVTEYTAEEVEKPETGSTVRSTGRRTLPVRRW